MAGRGEEEFSHERKVKKRKKERILSRKDANYVKDAEHPATPDDPHDVLSELTEPMIYLSALQATCRRSEYVRMSIPTLARKSLPCWVPAREVGAALGFDSSGVDRALQSLGGKPYLWATEFENVHSLWEYAEPEIEIDGKVWTNSQARGRMSTH